MLHEIPRSWLEICVLADCTIAFMLYERDMYKPNAEFGVYGYAVLHAMAGISPIQQKDGLASPPYAVAMDAERYLCFGVILGQKRRGCACS